MSNFSLFQKYSFELTSEQKNLFEPFLKDFIEYNSHTNLSAIRSEDEIIEKHCIDSLFGLDFLQQNGLIKIIDIGSGGGFPGIPLKIMYPACEMTLLDSVQKKIRAQELFCKNLELKHIESVWARAENLHTDVKFAKVYDAVVSRATAYITKIIPWSAPFLRKWWYILLYKTPSQEERSEISKLCKKYHLTQKESITYTLANQEREILVFEKK